MLEFPVGRNIADLSASTRHTVAKWGPELTARVREHGVLKAAVFDLGRVVVPFHFSAAAEALCRNEKWNYTPELETTLMTSPHKVELERGTITFEDFFSRLSQDLGIKKTSVSQFEAMWADIFTLNPATESLMSALNAGGVRLMILSDTSPVHFRRMAELSTNVSNVEWKILSCMYGVMKADGERLFSRAITTLANSGIAPHEAVYFDDIEKYTSTAISLGLPAMQFFSPYDAARLIEEVWGLKTGLI